MESESTEGESGMTGADYEYHPEMLRLLDFANEHDLEAVGFWRDEEAGDIMELVGRDFTRAS
jgi:hypothetical protein